MAAAGKQVTCKVAQHDSYSMTWYMYSTARASESGQASVGPGRVGWAKLGLSAVDPGMGN